MAREIVEAVERPLPPPKMRSKSPAAKRFYERRRKRRPSVGLAIEQLQERDRWIRGK